MRTKPARLVSLNSIRVTKSWTAMMKKAISTIRKETIRMAIWTKFSKKPGKPDISAAAVSIGRPASMPAWASLPGRRKSSLDRLDPDAFRPRPAKLAKTISESL
ncbi:hypothetical protein D3C86_1378960 [compost metagenome]